MPYFRRRTPALVAVVAVTSLVAVACNGDDDDDAARELAIDRARLSRPCQLELLVVSEEGVAEALGDGFVAPGSVLDLGDPATVPFQAPRGLVPVELVVDAIEQGERGDIEAAAPSERLDGMVPWYVHVTLTNRSDTPLAAVDPAGGLTLCSGDEAAIPRFVVGEYEACPQASVNEIAGGASAAACGIFLLPEGERPLHVAYAVPDTPFALAPVRWDAG